jgi:hypothetical protein
MSESEKFEEQGRAHASLKAAKSIAATRAASLAAYERDLENAAALVHQLVQNPLRVEPRMKLSDHVKQVLNGLQKPADAIAAIDELVAETERAEQLQSQIDNF